MNPVLGTCPVCGDPLMVTRLHCRSCDTTIEGQFEAGRLTRLSPEQLDFAEAFIRNEGKLNRLEGDLGMSYPTLRSRLHAIIRAMGYEVGQEVESGIPEEERHQILDDLSSGKLTTAEAMQLLHGGGEISQ